MSAAALTPPGRMPEKAVQAAVVRLYRVFGCVVYGLSQPRATMQSEGIPDLLIFAPRRGVAWWHECKTVGGHLSANQAAFGELCHLCHVGHVVGGLEAAKAQLAAVGLVARIA